MQRVPRSLFALALLPLALLPSVASADLIPGTETQVAALASDLAWEFSVTNESAQESPTVRKDVWRFKSVEPLERTERGPIYLRFSLTVLQFGDEQGADEQGAIDHFTALSEKDDLGFGFTKSSARVYRRGEIFYRLDLPCLFSRENVGLVTAALTASFPEDDQASLDAIYCRCGAGCATGWYSRQQGFDG